MHRLSRVGIRARFQSTSIRRIAGRLVALSGDSSVVKGSQGEAVRVTVFGDAFAKKEALLNALLENTQTMTVLKETSPLADLSNFNSTSSIPVRVSYGSTHAQSGDSVTLGLDWLNTYNAEIVSLPSTAPAQVISDTISQSDVTILVTDANAPLSAQSDVAFLEKHAEKPNLFIAANNSSSIDSVAELSAYINTRAAQVSDSSRDLKIPVFPVNSNLAREAQANPSSPSFQSTWTQSGVQDLKTHLLKSISGDTRARTLTATARYNTRAAATSLRADTANSLDLLRAVEKRVQGVLVKGLVAEEDRLRAQFVKGDLRDVGARVGTLLASLREYLSRVGVLGLVWRAGESLGRDLEARVQANSLVQAEYKMTYATGRLNEGLYTLYARTRAELTSLAGPTHPLSAYATTKELQNDITRILDILDKQASGVQADTFVLRNLVANGFDVSGCVEEVQEKGSQIVRSLFGSQIFFVCGGIFATYLGVPWAISIPSTVLVSGAGFVFHHFRWTAAQDRFISRVSETQKILEARLMEAYDKEFTRVVSDPLALIVKMLSGAVEKSGEEAKKVLEEVDGLIKEIDDTSK